MSDPISFESALNDPRDEVWLCMNLAFAVTLQEDGFTYQNVFSLASDDIHNFSHYIQESFFFPFRD